MGYSTFPADLATSPNLDGVVISFQYFGVGGHTTSPYNVGRTTTHEVGHWLDLRHIWGDNISCLIDDGVADTPVQREATYGCPSFPRTDICTTTSPGIMFMNYMDYTDDGCMNLFTSGQKARSRAIFDDLTGLRRQMLTLAGIITNPPIITGPASFCSGYGGTYTVSNAPAGFTWDKSSNLTITSNSGNSITVSSSGSGGGWVAIKHGSVEIARYSVDVKAAPSISYIDGPSGSVSEYTTYDYEVILNTYDPSVTYHWEIQGDPSYYYISSPYSKRTSITFNVPYWSYLVSVTVNNSCGYDYAATYTWTYNEEFSYACFPNPAGDILNIEIDRQAIAKAKAKAQQQADGSQKSAASPSFEIRLYNSQGTQVRNATSKGGTVQFNVVNLPNGFYYLHIYNGVDTNPEMRQIRIQH